MIIVRITASTTNAAVDIPTAIPTTMLSSSSSAPVVDCLRIYSLSTISGPSSYDNVILPNTVMYVHKKYL